jgi:hypothetical protein
VNLESVRLVNGGVKKRRKIALLGAALLLSFAAQAALVTWHAGGADINWTTAVN